MLHFVVILKVVVHLHKKLHQITYFVSVPNQNDVDILHLAVSFLQLSHSRKELQRVLAMLGRLIKFYPVLFQYRNYMLFVFNRERCAEVLQAACH